MPELAPAEARLRDWLQTYRATAGAAAEDCLKLFERLNQGRLHEAAALEELGALLRLLAELKADPRTISSAMLFVAHLHGEDLAPHRASLPAGILRQIDSLLQLRQVQAENPPGTSRNAEGLRRLLLALVSDVRVVLLALAWQLVQLQRVKGDTAQAAELGRETLLIHAPLANRLGVWQLKWELEDLAFRNQDPEEYRRIARQVAERRADRERFIREFIGELEKLLREAGIPGEVLGRPKHIYSIWKKLQRKGLEFEELFDLRAVRVLVDDLPSCYSVLGLVHTRWQPVPGEFDDYITTPKGNDYKSLHTAVVGPEGKAVEVQIRTREMNAHAELGVAAHWRYKEGGPNDPAFDRKIAAMRQLLDTGEEALDDESLLESFRAATSEERVYVLTPKGEVVDLALGATVLDFAYQVHTMVGHRCRGAKVNGRIVQLTHKLATGERVEILTGREPHPSRDWLNPRLGYIQGARARSKVRQWFRHAGHASNLAAGRELLEAELKRMGLTLADLETVPPRFHLKTLDELCAGLGNGDFTVAQVTAAAERARVGDAATTADDLLARVPRRTRPEPVGEGQGITIEGVGNLATTIARCCQPVPGDAVVGYITRGRGVTIHREDCRNVLRWQHEDSQRLLQVRWGQKRDSAYEVGISLSAVFRRELYKDISAVMTSAEVQVTEINTRAEKDGDLAELRLRVRVRNYEQLSELLARLATIRNVLEAKRVRD